jgi:hypothetical protein
MAVKINIFFRFSIQKELPLYLVFKDQSSANFSTSHSMVEGNNPSKLNRNRQLFDQILGF